MKLFFGLLTTFGILALVVIGHRVASADDYSNVIPCVTWESGLSGVICDSEVPSTTSSDGTSFEYSDRDLYEHRVIWVRRACKLNDGDVWIYFDRRIQVRPYVRTLDNPPPNWMIEKNGYALASKMFPQIKECSSD